MQSYSAMPLVRVVNILELIQLMIVLLQDVKIIVMISHRLNLVKVIILVQNNAVEQIK